MKIKALKPTKFGTFHLTTTLLIGYCLAYIFYIDLFVLCFYYFDFLQQNEVQYSNIPLSDAMEHTQLNSLNFCMKKK